MNLILPHISITGMRNKLKQRVAERAKNEIINRIEQRAAERAKRVTISEDIDLIDKTVLKSQRDNLARYADKNKCTLNFVQNEDDGRTVMKVYKDRYSLYRPLSLMPEFSGFNRFAVPYDEHIYQGTADIPSSRMLTTGRIYANKVKALIKDVLEPTNKDVNKKGKV